MEKLYSIQYLRALAALLVVVAHSFSHQIGVDNPLVVLAGRLGVVLFFAISGFIMVYISGAGPFSPKTFLKRRIIRIVPLYWLFTGFTALIAVAAPTLLQTTVFTWPHFVQSLLFIAHEAPGRGGTSPMLSLGWTLNYEAYFYVVFAALAALSATSRIRLLTLLFVAMWLFGLIMAPVDPVLQFYMNASPLAFAAGAWIGWKKLKGGIALEARHAGIFAAVAAAGVLLALLDDGSRWITQLGFAGQVAWAICLLVVALSYEPKLKRVPILEQLGDSSYALYLSHMFAIGAVTQIARRTIGAESDLTLILTTIGCIIVSCLAAILVHRLVEKPMLHLFARKPAAYRPPRANGMPVVG
ncbi:acyltransferase family protein [Rhizobium panacihumi]|uniref:acyltransferase family protein n=1 Tax=Rhizobium panacihumi TaxID=2008450 RepID=UPI003D79E07D